MSKTRNVTQIPEAVKARYVCLKEVIIYFKKELQSF